MMCYARRLSHHRLSFLLDALPVLITPIAKVQCDAPAHACPAKKDVHQKDPLDVCFVSTQGIPHWQEVKQHEHKYKKQAICYTRINHRLQHKGSEGILPVIMTAWYDTKQERLWIGITKGVV